MVKYQLFSYKSAQEILESKNLFREIDVVLRRVKRVDHKEMQEAFHDSGWELEKRAWGAFKDKVAISIELKPLRRRSQRFPKGNSSK
jgi:hypothetical protein